MQFYQEGRFRAQLRFLRCQFLQDGKLPFTDVLSESSVRQALTVSGVVWKDRIYTPLVTLWVFLSQVLSADHSCRAAVARLIAHRLSQGLKACSSRTGAYCQARGRLPEKFFSTVTRLVGRSDGGDLSQQRVCAAFHGRDFLRRNVGIIRTKTTRTDIDTKTDSDSSSKATSSGTSRGTNRSRTTTINQSRTRKQTLVARIVDRDIVASVQFYSPEEIVHELAARLQQQRTGEGVLIIDGHACYRTKAPLAPDHLSRTPEFAVKKLQQFLDHQHQRLEFASARSNWKNCSSTQQSLRNHRPRFGLPNIKAGLARGHAGDDAPGYLSRVENRRRAGATASYC